MFLHSLTLFQFEQAVKIMLDFDVTARLHEQDNEGAHTAFKLIETLAYLGLKQHDGLLLSVSAR